MYRMIHFFPTFGPDFLVFSKPCAIFSVLSTEDHKEWELCIFSVGFIFVFHINTYWTAAVANSTYFGMV